MNKRLGQWMPWLVVFVLYGLLWSYKRTSPYRLVVDEIHYWSTALRFSQQPLPSADLLYSYSELNTPLPFIMGGWIIQLFGENIRYLRLYNLLLSFLTISIFIRLNTKGLREFLMVLAGVCLAPYFIYCSLYYYTDLTALLPVVAGMALYARQRHWGSGLCFALAIAARQYAVAFPVAILVFEALSLLREKKFRFVASLQSLWGEKRYWLIYFLAAGTLLGWVLFWGGLGPPAEMARQYYRSSSGSVGGFNVGFALYALACFGFYYLIPEAVLFGCYRRYTDFFTRRWGVTLVIASITGLLLWLFPVRQTYTPYFTIPFIDPLDRWLTEAGFSFVGRQVVYGVLACFCILRFFTCPPSLAAVIVGVHVLLMGKTQIAWDKYVMPALVVLWLLNLLEAHRQPDRPPPASPLSALSGPR